MQKVLRNQFVIEDGSIIHTPTGAEFTPVSNAPDSLLVWTGDVGNVLETGERYRYADVLAMMKTLWPSNQMQVWRAMVRAPRDRLLARQYRLYRCQGTHRARRDSWRKRWPAIRRYGQPRALCFAALGRNDADARN
jgi:hypothetical protein